MRLWSVHPSMLDSKGLVALWREGLLAKKVLEGRTRGYTAHPQLIRFREHSDSLKMINAYLSEVYQESLRRGYNFSVDKIEMLCAHGEIALSSGQLEYEFEHLKVKLKGRSTAAYERLLSIDKPAAHPLFFIYEGGLESWEKR